MIGPGFFDAIFDGMILFFWAAIAAAFGLGMLVMWGVPKLWDWIKPIIHAATG